ncbi:unnamed protein product [Nippostrongylus brasiliensis]|uniref:Cationic amino acid transporter 4 (inferred by orthology to a human protein) n=1 Tax=Nippostrongylus brasiliensis TaxID=27835 RepID=A0A158R3L8_NIPBR|nr:unnamed protein product [Nippostrongylus brasiliensis]
MDVCDFNSENRIGFRCADMRLSSLRGKAFRLKHIPQGHLETQLRRCLTTLDITLLGIGHMIGAGIYNSSFFGDYPDVVAFLLIVVVAIFVALGSKTSTNFNSLFTIINMGVIILVVGYGITFADFSLWTGTDEEGKSNFFPYGVNGMLAGAASCFFAYIGFDGLATAGEEAKNPSRSIPLATFISMSVVTLAYVAMSASLTLMIPYYQVHPTAAFSDAFALKGATVAKIAVSVGGMFALPRCVFAMAEDGLLFQSLAAVNGKTQVPINAVLVFGSATAITALLFDIETLVEFLSIGTLLAYSIVSACVIILRYQPARYPEDGNITHVFIGGKLRLTFPGSRFLEQLDPGQSIHYGVAVMIFGFAGLGLCLSSGHFQEMSGMVTAAFFGAVSLLSVVFIMLHHQNSTPLDFKVGLAERFLTNYLPVNSSTNGFWAIRGSTQLFWFVAPMA